MTPKQTLSHALESSQMIDEVLENVIEKHYPSLVMAFANSSPEHIKAMLEIMMMNYCRELNEASKVLTEKYLEV